MKAKDAIDAFHAADCSLSLVASASAEYGCFLLVHRPRHLPEELEHILQSTDESRAIKVALLRQVEATDRIRQACGAIEAETPNRVEWGRDTAEVTIAAGALDESIVDYMNDDCTVAHVGEAFRNWIRSLEAIAKPDHGNSDIADLMAIFD